MRHLYRRLFLLSTLFICGGMAFAQLPNEKFGKPSSMEWDFNGWGESYDTDAIILCKTMKVTYTLSDQVFNNNHSFPDVGVETIDDFGKNQIDEANILVNYEFRLRTKIMKQEGVKHANIDITYYHGDNFKIVNNDMLKDLKIKVFTKNEKGKVEKRNVNTSAFVKERVDDNYMVMHVTVPDVQPGSIIEYQYNITSTRPTFLYDWMFQECIPTLHSKCDIEIPAIYQFNMNAPINRLIKSSVEAGRLAYDTNRPDLKRGKSCPTNHYMIIGDYILPEGFPLRQNQNDAEGKNNAVQEKIATLTSKINMPHVTLPAYLPEGYTHLKIK